MTLTQEVTSVELRVAVLFRKNLFKCSLQHAVLAGVTEALMSLAELWMKLFGTVELQLLPAEPLKYGRNRRFIWMSWLKTVGQCVYRVSLKKRYFSDFLSYFSSRGRILLFHMCFGIRILSPFHLAIQKVSIQNLNCPKNACEDMIFIPAQSSLRKAGIKIMSAHAFLGQYRFWMDTFWIARWNRLEILIPKHMWKSKIRPRELKLDKKSLKYLFLETPCRSLKSSIFLWRMLQYFWKYHWNVSGLQTLDLVPADSRKRLMPSVFSASMWSMIR